MVNFDQLPEQLLSLEECQQIDQTLLPAQDKFAVRIAIYALRYLQPVAEHHGIGVGDLQIEQIAAWVDQDQRLPSPEVDQEFVHWYQQILFSALRPLRQIAQDLDMAIAELTVPQIVSWFEQDVQARLGLQRQKPL